MRLSIIWFLVGSVALAEAPQVKHETSFVAYAADANHSPPIVAGGRLLTEMDRCAGITVRRFLYSSPTGARDAVTVGITDVNFSNPAWVKDLLFVSGRVVDVGEKTIKVEVLIERERNDSKRVLLVSGIFIFAAYDPETKKAMPHGIKLEPK